MYYDNVKIGRAAIDVSLSTYDHAYSRSDSCFYPQNLNLVPGENSIDTEFHYMPDDANDTTAQGFITDFLQSSDNLPLTIKGDDDSSPYGSLVPALEGISLSSSLTGA